MQLAGRSAWTHLWISHWPKDHNGFLSLLMISGEGYYYYMLYSWYAPIKEKGRRKSSIIDMQCGLCLESLPTVLCILQDSSSFLHKYTKKLNGLYTFGCPKIWPSGSSLTEPCLIIVTINILYILH